MQEFPYCENNRACQEETVSQGQRQTEARQVANSHRGGGCWKGGNLEPSRSGEKKGLSSGSTGNCAEFTAQGKSLGVVKSNPEEKE